MCFIISWDEGYWYMRGLIWEEIWKLAGDGLPREGVNRLQSG